MTTYGFTVNWRDSPDVTTSVSVRDCATPAQAQREAMIVAKSMGYRPPRWWQWWRWGEIKYGAQSK